MLLDVTVLGALVAGLLSFLSPCILPMVPFYLSYLAGTSAGHLAGGTDIGPEVRTRAVVSASLFAAGIIILMGLHFLGVIRIGFLYRQFRADTGNATKVSLAGAYVLGLAFAFGWTPCVGPILAAILMTAAGRDSVDQGVWLLFVYGLGMTLPFVLAALFVGPFMRFMARFRRHLGTVEKGMGVLLIVFGVLIATDTINYIAFWMLEYWPQFG